MYRDTKDPRWPKRPCEREAELEESGADFRPHRRHSSHSSAAPHTGKQVNTTGQKAEINPSTYGQFVCEKGDDHTPGKRQSLQQRMLEKLDSYMSKNEIRSFFNTYTKKILKCIKDLNMRPDRIKLPKENIGRILTDINLRNIFFIPSPIIMEMKTNINKRDLIKLKSFCTAKNTRKQS